MTSAGDTERPASGFSRGSNDKPLRHYHRKLVRASAQLCSSSDSGFDNGYNSEPEKNQPQCERKKTPEIKRVKVNHECVASSQPASDSAQSHSVNRLPPEFFPESGSDTDSYGGLRVRLGRSLQNSHRDSFAHQVQQLVRPFSALPPSIDQWGAEISQPLSALYSILVIIISACLAFSSQLTTNVDSMYSRYFDSALLAIGILFLMTSFAFLYRKNIPKRKSKAVKKSSLQSNSSSEQSSTGTYNGYFRSQVLCAADDSHEEQTSARVIYTEVDSANFYLKMGALSFAIGSMIYACLELGVFAENTSCFNTVMGLNPALFICFLILQLYFIFLNSRLTLRKYRTTGRFGLMHLISTNLCIWIRTLIDETLHAFGKLREENEKSMVLTENRTQTEHEADEVMKEHANLGKGGYNPLCINDESVMKKMMEEASVFLYPCIIEYSLICAGILYIMWTFVDQSCRATPDARLNGVRKPYAVDCDQAAKGLFVGIIIVVATVVSLILYFLFLDKPEYTGLAVFQAQMTEIVLYIIGLLAVLYSFVQMTKNLQRAPNYSVGTILDDTLLKISMVGVYAYSIASILGGYTENNTTGIMGVTAASLCLIQSTAQTIFIFDASQRALVWNPLQHLIKSTAPKPARETVTLLLIVNFALWATNVLCTLRAESSPSQTQFYGVHEWTVMLHVTVPLVIFYRFHSTACLFEIWKRAYKEKRPTTKDYPFIEHVTQV